MKQSKSDSFVPLSIKSLLNWIFTEEKAGSIFGIDKKLFFNPLKNKNIGINRYFTELETPIGVAAGPHTQLAQNIISAWLTGARYIELKTVQELDELDVSKPCIDMNDEGYNCEWSQELKIEQSFNEYLKAWIVIYILKDRYGWNNGDAGFIFNLSVGYDYEGILKDKVQWFLAKMSDCSIEKSKMIKEISLIYPQVEKLLIPDRISNNITLSTMHGCPSDEIEKIGSYLIRKKYHTTIKLNPTLLGAEELRTILNSTLNFDIRVPDIAFEHDLKYKDAIRIITNLRNEAKTEGVVFSIKLTNTLETENVLKVLPENEKMHYLSGRALHPISINLAKKLQTDFNGELDISFSAGAEAFNISDILACGLKPVTVSTDILKPGGYGRFFQYIEKINSAASEDKNQSGTANIKKLERYAEAVLNDESYKRTYIKRGDIKTNRGLNEFDCIAAPCQSNCGSNQDIPGYMYYAAKGDFDNAMAVISDSNPLPIITGTVCTQLCGIKCTRNNYDSALAIRKVKKTIAENSEIYKFKLKNKKSTGNVSIIGAGPSGLSCGYYLEKEGVSVSIYEKSTKAGGMVKNAIPKFRLTDSDIGRDIDKILNSNINVFYDTKVDKDKLKTIIKDNDFVYLSTGAPLSKKLNITGEDSNGVYEPLDFLFRLRNGEDVDLGRKVAIIGGGNTAMDTARSVRRLLGHSGNVSILYRRRIADMPADDHEIMDVLNEGIEVIELVSPKEIAVKNGKVVGIKLEKMRVYGIDKKGRGIVIKEPDSDFVLKVDSIIPAIGQDIDKEFIDSELIKNKKVFIGGDAERGASSIINGVGDGRRTALEILHALDLESPNTYKPIKRNISFSEHMIRRSTRIKPEFKDKKNDENELNLEYIQNDMSAKEGIKEASRCLYCDELCNICVTVCPNRANISYTIKPFNIELETLIIDDAAVKIQKKEYFAIDQKYQVLNVSDFCNECGNCNTFCPSNGAPYKEKPKICLTEQSFERENRGYYIYKKGNVNIINFKNGDIIKTLSSFDNYYLYETIAGTIKLSKDNFKFIDSNIKKRVKNPETIVLNDAFTMKIILENIPSYFFK